MRKTFTTLALVGGIFAAGAAPSEAIKEVHYWHHSYYDGYYAAPAYDPGPAMVASQWYDYYGAPVFYWPARPYYAYPCNPGFVWTGQSCWPAPGW